MPSNGRQESSTSEAEYGTLVIVCDKMSPCSVQSIEVQLKESICLKAHGNAWLTNNVNNMKFSNTYLRNTCNITIALWCGTGP